MFEITDSAAKQFKASAKAMGDDSLPLRVAARKPAAGGMIYNLGFDEARENDIADTINGIDVVVDPSSAEIIKTMIIDFREYEGQEQFVFINPNDTKDSCETSPDGCDPDGNPTCKSCLDED